MYIQPTPPLLPDTLFSRLYSVNRYSLRQHQSPLASNFSSCSAVLNFDADTPLAALSSHQSLSTEQSFFPQQYKKERPCDKLSSPAGRRIE